MDDRGQSRACRIQSGGPTIIAHGTDDQKARFLRQMTGSAEFNWSQLRRN